MGAVDVLKETFDIETVLTPKEARHLAISGLLKKNTKVLGDLQLSWTSVQNLPDGLVIDGHLNISGTQIKKLPSGLSVGRNLYMDNTEISRLPDDMQVKGNIHADPKSRALTKPKGVCGTIFPSN